MSILDEIVRHKKQEVAKSRKAIPFSSLFELEKDCGVSRAFGKALKINEDVAIIAEVKKASPSAGTIREVFNPVEIATAYKDGCATAISILTDERYFQGDLSYLSNIRNTVDLPLLRKDFTIDPYQILEARVHGADAILLIVSALSKDQCCELAAAADEYGLEFLVEVHDARELEFALGEEFGLIGINNRDLSTFTVDLATTEKLTPIIPPEVVTVAESGVKTRQDIERLSKANIDAVLIGEAFMRKDDMAVAVQEFTGIEKCLG